MQDYKSEFLALSLRLGVLRFGEFVLKSGRKSPYFFNAGLFNTGQALDGLGRYYARAIAESGIDFDMVFGPAYKGIPLAALSAAALYREHGLDVPYAFNRKEAKDHGEGGLIVGAPLSGRVLIVDDVITAGTAIRESVDMIRAHGAEPVAVAIALDRQERGTSDRSAVQEVEADLGLAVVRIVGLSDLVSYLASDPSRGPQLQALRQYRASYGI